MRSARNIDRAREILGSLSTEELIEVMREWSLKSAVPMPRSDAALQVWEPAVEPVEPTAIEARQLMAALASLNQASTQTIERLDHLHGTMQQAIKNLRAARQEFKEAPEL